MLKVLKDTKDKLRWGSLADITSSHISFIDCINPTDKELRDIAAATAIPLDELTEAIDPEERPRLMDFDSYSLVIYRTPYHSKNGTFTTPVAIFFSSSFVLMIRHQDMASLKRFYDLMPIKRKQLFENGSVFLFYWLIDEMTSDFFKLMDTLEDKINHIEARIYRSPKEHMIREIFSLKKTFIFFHKALTANREVVNAIEKEYLHQLTAKDRKRFRTIYNDIVELLDLESTYRDILTSAMDIYLTSVSNSLNVIIKKMTAMGSFILIPTLITGIYGMNFRFLPELDWKYGYAFALGLMIVSVLLLYIYFKNKDWL